MNNHKFICPICDSSDSKLWGVEYTGYRIFKCRSCGLRHLDPLQRPAAEFYSEEYFNHKASKMGDPEKLLLVLKSDADSIARLQQFSVKARELNASILDIGAGRGSFLILCKLLGFNSVAGTDITDANVEFLRGFGIDINVGDLTALEPGKFEIVTFYHVLEHVNDPGKFLSAVRRNLRDDGIAHLLVPNEGSLNSRFKSAMSRLGLKRRAFKHLSPKPHLWYFEKRTLEMLLERCGFEIKYFGSRAHEKKRGPLNSIYHKTLDIYCWNTWLEAVIANKSNPNPMTNP